MRKIVILLFVFICSLISCKTFKVFSSFEIINHSHISIGVIPACLQTGFFYPDTIPPANRPAITFVSPKSQRELWHSGDTFENTFVHIVKNDTLSLFIYDRDTLEAYDWSDIRKEGKLIVRYDLSLSDIKKVTSDGKHPSAPFPPTMKMKNIHMYPPYEEVIAKYGKSE